MTAKILSLSCSRVVWVVRVVHKALVDVEIPGPRHPAAIAAIDAVVFTEVDLVLRVSCQRTVDELLLRDAHRCSVVLLGNGALEGSVGSERPAGTALALVFDGMNEAILDVINVSGVLNAEALSRSSASSQRGSLLLSAGLVKTHSSTVLITGESRVGIVL